MPFTQEYLMAQGLKTGDIVLFNGHGLVSGGIKYATWSNYSHVGMVVNTNKGLCFFESVGSGVRLTPLETILNNYDGAFKVRQLKSALSEEQIDKLFSFINANVNKSYEKSYLELFLSALNLNSKKDTTSFFCSELVAEAYQQMGIFSTRVPSNDFTPKDFSANSKYKDLKNTQFFWKEASIPAPAPATSAFNQRDTFLSLDRDIDARRQLENAACRPITTARRVDVQSQQPRPIINSRAIKKSVNFLAMLNKAESDSRQPYNLEDISWSVMDHARTNAEQRIAARQQQRQRSRF